MEINVPSYDEVSVEAKIIFDKLKATAGKVPNLYATIGCLHHRFVIYLFLQYPIFGIFYAFDVAFGNINDNALSRKGKQWF